MNIYQHPLCTQLIGAPSDMPDPACAALPVSTYEDMHGHWTVSYWMPTAGEVAALGSGAAISLHVRAYGRQHPVVSMRVAHTELSTRLDEAAMAAVMPADLQAPKIGELKDWTLPQLYDLCCRQSHAVKEYKKCVGRYQAELSKAATQASVAATVPQNIGRDTALSDEVIDHCWRMYQQGQISADHTAKEAFAQTLQSLANWLAAHPANDVSSGPDARKPATTLERAEKKQ